MSILKIIFYLSLLIDIYQALQCSEKTEDASNEECIGLEVAAENTDTHICILDGTKCRETNLCSEAKYVTSDSQCGKLTFSEESDLKKCVKQTDGNECIEQLLNCEEKTTGGSDDVCSKLTPSENHACLKDPDGEGCKNIPYCKHANGDSDEDCKNYPVEKEGNKCIKSEAGNTCDEKEEEAPNEDDDENSQSNESTGKNSDKGEEKESDKGTEKDSDKVDEKESDKGTEKDSEKVDEKGSDKGTDKDENKSTDEATSKESNTAEQGQTNDKEGKASFIGLSFVYFCLLYLL